MLTRTLITFNGVKVSSLNCTGAGVTCTTNGSTGTINVTNSGGGGGGGGNYRLFLDGADTGINVSSANFVSGNGLGLQIFSSSFTLSIPSTASIVISTLQANSRILISTNSSTYLFHISTNNGYSRQLMAISTGSTNLFDLTTSSLQLVISTVIFYGGTNTFVTIASTHPMPFPLNVGPGPDNPGIWNNAQGFSPTAYLHRNTHAIFTLRDDGASPSELLMQADPGGDTFGTFTNNALFFFTNNISRAQIPAAGGWIVKSTDLVIPAGGLVGIGTTTPKAMLHLNLMGGATTDMTFMRMTTGPTIMYEFAITSWTVPSTSTIGGITYVWPQSQASGIKVLSNDGAGNLSWQTDATGGGGGGGAIVVQQGAGSYSGAISSLTATNDVVFDIRSGSVNVKVDLSTLNTRANNTDLSTASLNTSISNLIAAVQLSTSAEFSQFQNIVSTNIKNGSISISSLTTHTEIEFFADASAITPAISSPCMPTVQSFETATNKVRFNAIGFSSFTGVNYGFFNHSLPKGWNGSTVSFHVVWTSTSTGSAGQTVVWGMQALSLSSGSAMDAAQGSSMTVTSSVTGTANIIQKSTEALVMTVGGSPVQGSESPIFWQIFRDKTDARDNFQGQANLIEVRIRYTKEYLTDR